MARPKKKGLDYFPHDCDASGDEKLEPIEALYGNDGYAVYFKLLERIYRAGGVLDLSDPDTTVTLAKKCNLTVEKFNEILDKCLDKNLFDRAKYVRKKYLTSDGIQRRVAPITGKRLKWRKKKAELLPDNGGVFSGENPPETPQRKGNKTKEKEIKQNEIPRACENSPPVEVERPKAATGALEQEQTWTEFKTHYPARNGKFLGEQEAFRRFCWLPQSDWPKLILAAKNYAASQAVKSSKDGQGIYKPENFIGIDHGPKPWREWLEPEKPPDPKQDKRFAFLDQKQEPP